MKKQLVVFFTVFCSLFLGPVSALSDGMAIKPDPYSMGWDYLNETGQGAFIDYRQGLEKMVIKVNLESSENSDALWLFPVPSNPEKIVIDVVNWYPRISGEDISARAKFVLSTAKKALFNTQIYPYFFQNQDYYRYNTLSIESDIVSGGLKEVPQSINEDVVVYEHLDKNGMSSEIITAKTSNGLYAYFEDKGLKIEKGMIPALDAYIGRDYSFVASWITQETPSLPETEMFLYSTEEKDESEEFIDEIEPKRIPIKSVPMETETFPTPEPETFPETPPLPFNKTIRAVSVMFPADKIYFPLLPTSVYDSKIIPATLIVSGHVTPEIYSVISNFVKTTYYVNGFSYNYGFSGGNESQNQLGDFFSEPNFKYTKIKIAAPSKYLTEDLWIKDNPPFKAVYSSFIALHSGTTEGILLLFCSLLAVFISGLLLLKGLRKRPLKLLALGLSNCLTVIGLAAATLFVQTQEPSEKETQLLEEAKKKGYAWKRKTALILFIAAAFSLVFPFFFMYGLSPFKTIAPLVPIALVVIGLEIRRIKESDQDLFKQLKTAGYSSWTFQRKNPKKILFVIFSSLLFLSIVWLAVKLLTLAL